MQAKYGASQSQACAVLSISRSVYHYRSRRADQAPLVMRIKEIAAARVRYGYQRIHVVLRREGWMINRKRVYRAVSARRLVAVRTTPQAASLCHAAPSEAGGAGDQ